MPVMAEAIMTKTASCPSVGDFVSRATTFVYTQIVSGANACQRAALEW
jgi:hypothetical protein